MNDSRSWTEESETIPTNSSKDQERTDSNSYSSEKDNRDLYKISSEQIIIHRWFLSNIQSLNNQEKDFYLQSSSFGCTGENGFLQWIIRFHPIVSSLSKTKDDEDPHQTLLTESINHLFSEILIKPISNIEQSTITKEDAEKVHIPISKPSPQYSVTTTEEESSSDDKSYCAFEVLRVNGNEPSSQALFETTYQVFEVSDDGVLNLLKTEGRHQVHFHRAFIILPRDTIFSISSNNILFSIKLTIYECSSTVGYCQSNNKSLKKLTYEVSPLSNISGGDTNNPTIELSSGHTFWLMSIEKIFTDLIICSSDNQEFHVHRLIFCTSCEKFTELNSSMNRIEIHSINGFILKRILKYIYTGEIEICIGEFSIDEIRDLLNAADLFELIQLKNILIKKCLNHITQKNCLDLLQIADDKQLNILKNRILTFLSQQFSQIFNTDTWQQFCDTRPHLINETFANLLRLNHLQKSIIEQFQEKKS